MSDLLIGDPASLEVCKYCVSKPARNVIDLTEDSQDDASGAGSPAGTHLPHNDLYTFEFN